MCSSACCSRSVRDSVVGIARLHDRGTSPLGGSLRQSDHVWKDGVTGVLTLVWPRSHERFRGCTLTKLAVLWGDSDARSLAGADGQHWAAVRAANRCAVQWAIATRIFSVSVRSGE